jgi:hypothetical protein
MNAKPATKREVAALVEYVRSRISELGYPPRLVELEEFCECLRVKLPVLTGEQAIEIVRLALHYKNIVIAEAVPVIMGRPRKLTPEQQADALQRLGRGESQESIGKSLGVDDNTIGRLRSNKWNLRG